MKKIVCFLITILLFFCACTPYKSWLGKRPCDQPNTQWVSENGQIYINVDENGQSKGTILVGTEKQDIYFGIGLGGTINVYSKRSEDGYRDADRIEHWVGDFNKENEFSVIVKETTYFEIGQKINFYRVDKED